MRALVVAALAALLSFPLSVHAQDAVTPAPPPRVGQACHADIQSFCPNIAPGPALHTCVTTNLSKMSAGCQTAFNTMQAAGADIRKACGPDIKQYCASAQGPARRQCVNQNETKFSTACQAALAQKQGGGQPPAPSPQ